MTRMLYGHPQPLICNPNSFAEPTFIPAQSHRQSISQPSQISPSRRFPVLIASKTDPECHCNNGEGRKVASVVRRVVLKAHSSLVNDLSSYSVASVVMVMKSNFLVLRTHIAVSTHAITSVAQPAFRRQPWENVCMGFSALNSAAIHFTTSSRF